jgi:hypothetical protein
MFRHDLEKPKKTEGKSKSQLAGHINQNSTNSGAGSFERIKLITSVPTTSDSLALLESSDAPTDGDHLSDNLMARDDGPWVRQPPFLEIRVRMAKLINIDKTVTNLELTRRRTREL